MHVLIDAAILKPGLGGIATYAEGIARALAARPGVRVTVATSLPERFAGLEGVEVVALAPAVRGFARRWAWRERALAGLARRSGADVVLAASIELPLRRLPVPSVVVLHDAGPLVAPEFYDRARRARFAALLGPVLRRATRVAAVSEATRAQVAAALPRLRTPVRVVREGPRVGGALPWAPDPEPYVLYVGPAPPHKNVATLVRAFAEPGLTGVGLRIAGSATAAERAELAALAGDLDVALDHLGFVGDDALARLYAGARAVALPSLHEGFGLPLLEALAAGAPVVASPVPAHREVGADAARYVGDPRDPAAWARELAAAIGAPEDAERAAAGLLRVRHYTWEGAADDLLGVLGEAVAGKP